MLHIFPARGKTLQEQWKIELNWMKNLVTLMKMFGMMNQLWTKTSKDTKFIQFLLLDHFSERENCFSPDGRKVFTNFRGCLVGPIRTDLDNRSERIVADVCVSEQSRRRLPKILSRQRYWRYRVNSVANKTAKNAVCFFLPEDVRKELKPVDALPSSPGEWNFVGG